MIPPSKKTSFELSTTGERSWRGVLGGPQHEKKSSVIRWRKFWWVLEKFFMLAVIVGAGVLIYFSWKELEIADAAVSFSGENVRFESDQELGLTRTWFLDYTGLNAGARLSIFQIKEKLEQQRQIKAVAIERLSENQLQVRVGERVPVARLEGVLPNGERVVRVVSHEGVIYEGINYGALVFQNLPELTGAIARKSEDGKLDIVVGMDVVSPLILLAKERHRALYREWESVSLRDFVRGDVNAPGAVIRVRLREVSQPADMPRIRDVIFSAKDCMNEFVNYYSQAWFLDSIKARLRRENPGNFPQFDLYLNLENKSDPRHTFKEPRAIPVPADGAAQ